MSGYARANLVRKAVAEPVSRVICVPITLKIAQYIKSVVLMALFSRVQRIFNLQSRLVSLVVACKKITQRIWRFLGVLLVSAVERYRQ